MISNEGAHPTPSLYMYVPSKREMCSSLTQLSLSHRYGYMHCCMQCVCTVYALVQLWSGKAHQIWENQTLGDALGGVRSRSNLDIPVPWSLPALPTTLFFFFFFLPENFQPIKQPILPPLLALLHSDSVPIESSRKQDPTFLFWFWFCLGFF